MNNLTLNPLLKYILFIYFLLPGMANAQHVNINGKITDAETLKPLANAEVYIANTTIRAKTDTNGIYAISNLPTGSYELLARAETYETKGMDVAAVTIGNITINIALRPRITALPEVTISRSGIWKENLARFKREFIGLSPQANYKILNEYLLDLDYSSKTQLLTARTDDFLEIENLALGYKLRFLIKEFWADYNAGTYHYSGSVIFEELPGTEEERKKWVKNRYNVYDGSFRHFMTALTSNRVKENGFVLRRLLRTPNPKRPPDSLILLKAKEFRYVPDNKAVRDSSAKWGKLWKLPKIIETLEKYDVPAIAITKPGKLPQTYDLVFKDYLYIIYKNIVLKPSLGFIIPNPNELHRFDEAGSFQIAAISMKTLDELITFNDKGIQISKGRIFYEGAWNESRILGLLPFDYIPSKK